MRLAALRFQGVSGNVDDIIEEADRGRDTLFEPCRVEQGALLERPGHELRKINRAEKAGAVRRQRLLSAGVGGKNLLAVGEVVHAVDAIDENHAGLGKVIRRAHDAMPEIARGNGAIDDAVEDQIPRRIGLDGGHEGVGDEDGQVEVAQARCIGLHTDEGLDVRVIAAQGRHHGAAASAGGHDGAAHGVPHVHETDGARCVRADAFDRSAFGTQRREIMPDAATLLHRKRGFLDVVEDGRQIVFDAAHDETVEERYRAARTGACENAAGGQEFEVLHRLGECLCVPGAAFLATTLNGRCGLSDARKRVVQPLIAGVGRTRNGPNDICCARSLPRSRWEILRRWLYSPSKRTCEAK